MLGGVAPVLIFNFPPLIGGSVFQALSGIPLIGGTVANIGIPIPLYLDPNFTGIMIKNETSAMDVDTEIVPKYGPTGNTVENYINQSGINNIVTIEMEARHDNIFLASLLALNDMVFSRLVQTKYSISYINRNTVVFGGLLHSFSKQGTDDDDLLRVTLQIQKPNDNKPTPTNLYFAPLKASGALPVVPS